MNTVTVNRKGEDRLRSGHPWIYASDVTDRGVAEPGDAVTILAGKNKRLGVAHYSSTSQITLRLLTSKQEPIDAAFFARRLEEAQRFRQTVVDDTEAYRLVHAEADRLPGLIVDRYGDALSIQFLDQGMDRASGPIVSALQAQLNPAFIVARNDVPVRRHEALPLETQVLSGEARPVTVRMNGLLWQVDLVHGQKTGIYLDQRENYRAAAQWAHGRALDCFTSTGGFALHMAPRCSSVEAVDSSAEALQTAGVNRDANQIANVEFREANAFDLLSGYLAARRGFDTIVLDPPAFAKSRQNIDAAIRGYKDINHKALRLLNPGGILVTCSCSFHVTESALLDLVAGAAQDAGRSLRVLARRTQAADHPVLLTVPETLYLKCLIFQVLP